METYRVIPMTENWEKMILYLLQLPLNLLKLRVERKITNKLPHLIQFRCLILQENSGHKPGDTEIQQLESYQCIHNNGPLFGYYTFGFQLIFIKN